MGRPVAYNQANDRFVPPLDIICMKKYIIYYCYCAGRGTGSSEERGKLSKVTQLTGFSDPVYAEAIVAVNQYDIVLDVLVVNQTGKLAFHFFISYFCSE